MWQIFGLWIFFRNPKFDPRRIVGNTVCWTPVNTEHITRIVVSLNYVLFLFVYSFFFSQALSQSTYKRPDNSNYHKAACTFFRHFHLVHRKQRLAAMFTIDRHLTLTWDRWIQTTVSLTFSVWTKLMPHTVRFSNQNFENLYDISSLCYALRHSHLRKIHFHNYACWTAHKKFFINQFSPTSRLFILSPFDTTNVFFIRRGRKIAISCYYLYHICPQGTRLPLDGFLWHLIFENFSKIFREKFIFL